MENEPFKLKHLYSPELVHDYADRLSKIWAPFQKSKFIEEVLNQKWEHLELKERMRRVSECLRMFLPDAYSDAIEILLKSCRQLLEEHGERMIFAYGFIADFVEQFGLQHVSESIKAIEEITVLTSCEFAVRPFLKKYPEIMYPQMQAWADHKNPLVRRLATEGFRPRLPWGMGIPVLKKDPSHMLPILEKLKNDPAETVRRSVANHLNDISKDHPSLAMEIANRWFGKNKNVDWVVRHACRGLLKAGHPEALFMFGFDPNPKSIVLSNFICDEEVHVGNVLHFSFTVINTGTTHFKTRLEYVVNFLTSTGKVSKKIFFIKEMTIAPGKSHSYTRKQRFLDLTTRKHYPGKHTISLVINGKEMEMRTFQVI
jgi:3-methyladenine DNA glycosylase AlkC